MIIEHIFWDCDCFAGQMPIARGCRAIVGRRVNNMETYKHIRMQYFTGQLPLHGDAQAITALAKWMCSTA
jgi:hypothetical protein